MLIVFHSWIGPLSLPCGRTLTMNGSANPTVMGPDRVTLPGKDILLPTFLRPNTDKYTWRKKVQLSATTVKRFARGGDKRAMDI